MTPNFCEGQAPAWLASFGCTQPDKVAFRFVDEHAEETSSMTYADLDKDARRIAFQLRSLRGERVLLAYTTGPDFVRAFFGCLYAGAIPVPIVPPRRGIARESTLHIALDCRAKMGFALPDTVDALARATGGATSWTTVGDFLDDDVEITPYQPQASSLAFLQYTSGSTSAPKGVMVRHENLRANVETLAQATSASQNTVYGSWLPLFHDMGLVWNVITPIFLGATCVLMDPLSFVRRPLSWLRMVTRYRCNVSGAPNFAYDLLVSRYRTEGTDELDLSSWDFAYNAAEPVRSDTVDAFLELYRSHGLRAEAIQVAYGMAEATLMISGGPLGTGARRRTTSRMALLGHRLEPPQGRADVATVFGCGKVFGGQEVLIVNPETRAPCSPTEIGEIWVRGPGVASGYWENAETTEATFQGRLANGHTGIPFLRTGDLGFLCEREVYVTGRYKDMLIVRGQNYYPQDLEKCVEGAHRGLRRNFSTVFVSDHNSDVFVSGHNSDSRLVVAVEVERDNKSSEAELVGSIREAIVREHDLTIADVVLLPYGSLAKTSSGKVQRNLMRKRYEGGQLTRWTPLGNEGDKEHGSQSGARGGVPACTQSHT